MDLCSCQQECCHEVGIFDFDIVDVNAMLSLVFFRVNLL